MPPSMQAEAPREEVACPKTEVESHQARVAARACLTVLGTFYSLLVAFNLDPDRVTAFQIGMGCGHFGLTESPRHISGHSRQRCAGLARQEVWEGRVRFIAARPQSLAGHLWSWELQREPKKGCEQLGRMAAD